MKREEKETDGYIKKRVFVPKGKQIPTQWKEARAAETRSQNDRKHPATSNESDKTCPLGCKTKHYLAACPKFWILTVSQRWEIIKQHWRCRNFLRAHHTNNCKKPDNSTCDKCRKTSTGAYIMRRLKKQTQVWTPQHHRLKVSSKGPQLHRLVTSKGMLCTRKAVKTCYWTWFCTRSWTKMETLSKFLLRWTLNLTKAYSPRKQLIDLA